MYLISKENQRVTINGSKISLCKGESILTEVSYKYTLKGFARLAQQAGFSVQSVWADPKNYFNIQYLTAN
jgi:uncharacterized SAM-dependent methyltransferase